MTDGLVLIVCLAWGAGCLGYAFQRPLRAVWRTFLRWDPMPNEDELPRARVVKR